MNPFPKRTFEALVRYLVKGSDLTLVWEGLRARTPVAGPGILLKETDAGFIIESTATGGGGEGNPPAFFRLYEADSKWMLQGGQVTGGAGNEVVADIELATVGIEPVDGTKHWLEVTGNGTLTEGILYGGYEVTAAVAADGATMPDNTLPTVATATGRKFHLLLGMWNDEVFSPAAGGNLNVGFCPGAGYQPGRF